MDVVTIRLRRVSISGLVILNMPMNIIVSLMVGFRSTRGRGDALLVSFVIFLLLILANAILVWLFNAFMRTARYPLTVEVDLGRDIDHVIEDLKAKRTRLNQKETLAVPVASAWKNRGIRSDKPSAKTQPLPQP